MNRYFQLSQHGFLLMQVQERPTVLLIVMQLLISGADPDKILCITFTNSAAEEMKSRYLSVLLSGPVWKTAFF